MINSEDGHRALGLGVEGIAGMVVVAFLKEGVVSRLVNPNNSSAFIEVETIYLYVHTYDLYFPGALGVLGHI